MGKYVKCFSCTYCLQDCCSCLYSTRFRQLISYLFCLPCWDSVCHRCRKYCCPNLTCTTNCCKCTKGPYTAYLCDCCSEDNYTLEISDNSLQINHYTNMSKEGKDGDLTVPANVPKHKHTGSPTTTKKPARVRFQLDKEDEHCDISEEQTTESKIQDSAAILPSEQETESEIQGLSETKDMIGDKELMTVVSEDGTGDEKCEGNDKEEKSEKQSNVSVFDSDDCHKINILVTGFKQTSV